jgi:hypothetical protein
MAEKLQLSRETINEIRAFHGLPPVEDEVTKKDIDKIGKQVSEVYKLVLENNAMLKQFFQQAATVELTEVRYSLKERIKTLFSKAKNK